MIYFKNVELAEKYHVSLGTVRNWIRAAAENKLTLHLVGGRQYIANTSSNVNIIEQLVSEGKKYRNTRAAKEVSPRKEFYSLYNQAQIYDIVTNLEVRREIPRQYNYFDGGANSWDQYIQRMDREAARSNLTMTRKLLEVNKGYIDDLMKDYQKINVVDIGIGNALPVKEFLAHLLESNKLGRYIAIDISPEMLKLAERNIAQWFRGKIDFEGIELDITRERFGNVLAEDYIQNASKHTGNLILFVGGTLQNFKKRDVPLQVINDSMGVNDFLLHTQKLDSAATRHHFDFSEEPGEQILPPIHGLVVDLLSIDSSLYDLVLGYDEQLKERFERIRFKMALTIKIDFDNGQRLIKFDKGESILLWRASQDTALDLAQQFDQNDFYMLHSSQSEDREYILTISQVKAE